MKYYGTAIRAFANLLEYIKVCRSVGYTCTDVCKNVNADDDGFGFSTIKEYE